MTLGSALDQAAITLEKNLPLLVVTARLTQNARSLMPAL